MLSTSDDGTVLATKLGVMESDDFFTPATSAVYDGYVYSANSFFYQLDNIADPSNNTVVAVEDTLLMGSPITETSPTMSAATDAPSTAPASGAMAPASGNVGWFLRQSILVFVLMLPVTL